MNLRSRMYLPVLWLLMLTACTNAVSSAEGSSAALPHPDPDAVDLMRMGEQAIQLAQETIPGAVLLQMDTDLAKTSFRFMDAAATQEIHILVPSATAPLEQWRVQATEQIKPGPGFNLNALQVGPRRVTQAITTEWPGCTARGLTLYGQGNNLTWTVFCETPEGVAAGSLDNQTGVFEAWGPPVHPPATALPIP